MGVRGNARISLLQGGTHVGSMKLIGETIQEGQFLVSDGAKMRRGLKAIGICSWGYIAEEESLVNDQAREFKYEQKYQVS